MLRSSTTLPSAYHHCGPTHGKSVKSARSAEISLAAPHICRHLAVRDVVFHVSSVDRFDWKSDWRCLPPQEIKVIEICGFLTLRNANKQINSNKKEIQMYKCTWIYINSEDLEV